MKTPLLVSALLFAAIVNAQDPYKKSSTAPAPAAVKELSSIISLREETFAIPRKDAPAFLSQFPGDAARHAELLRRVESGTATLDRVILLRAKSGTRAISEAIEEFRYQTNLDAAKEPEFETRNIGDTLEVEPVLGVDGRAIDLNLVTQCVRFAGYSDTRGASKVHQPIFHTRKATTSITLQAGEPALIGSLNPSSESALPNAPKDERLHLDFITAFVGSDAPAQTSRTAALGAGLILSKIELRDATLAESVQFLQVKSRELDPEKKGVNFVLKAPPSSAAVKVSLELTNIPIAEAARYLAELAGLKLTIQENALVLAP